MAQVLLTTPDNWTYFHSHAPPTFNSLLHHQSATAAMEKAVILIPYELGKAKAGLPVARQQVSSKR